MSAQMGDNREVEIRLDEPTTAEVSFSGSDSSGSDATLHTEDCSEQRDTSWPSYAVPQKRLPNGVAELLRPRVSRLADLQLKVREGKLNAARPAWSAEFRTGPKDCATWMSIIRSRWLFLETLSGRLELWDLEGVASNGAVSTFSGLSGNVDGYVVDDEAGRAVRVYISTSTYHVYKFVLDLPYIGEGRNIPIHISSPAEDILQLAGIKFATDEVLATAKHETEDSQGFLRFPALNNVTVSLQCGTRALENQGALDILVHDRSVFVVRSTSLEIYSLDQITPATSSIPSTTLPSIVPHCIVPLKEPTLHARLVRPRPDQASQSFSQIRLWRSASPYWTVDQLDMTKTGEISPDERWKKSRTGMSLSRPAAYSLGDSGFLLAQANRGLVEVTYLHNDPRGRDKHGYLHGEFFTLGCWSLPWDNPDCPRALAFDDSAGIVVVGMDSGRILVGDLTSPELPPGDESVLVEDTSEYLRPPITLFHPDPKHWPAVALSPAYDPPKSLPLEETPPLMIEGWSEAVNKYFPGVNNKIAYGGVPWFVKKILGIPFDAHCVAFSSRELTDESMEGAIIQIDSNIDLDQKLLFLWFGLGRGGDCQTYKFRSGVTWDMIVECMRRRGSLLELCDDEALEEDFVQWEQRLDWDACRSVISNSRASH